MYLRFCDTHADGLMKIIFMNIRGLLNAQTHWCSSDEYKSNSCRCCRCASIDSCSTLFGANMTHVHIIVSTIHEMWGRICSITHSLLSPSENIEAFLGLAQNKNPGICLSQDNCCNIVNNCSWKSFHSAFWIPLQYAEGQKRDSTVK